MAIPAFTIDGVLPPFLGPDPGGHLAHMSPHMATAAEVVDRFATTDGRRGILFGWLEHRAAMRAIGIDRGFQWLDGSFLEAKEPNDLDLVTFVHPPGAPRPGPAIWRDLLRGNPHVFERSTVKARFKLDSFFVQMDGTPETLVSMSRYWLQLFSHQRRTLLWKGMLQVPLADASGDAAAHARLAAEAAPAPAGDQP